MSLAASIFFETNLPNAPTWFYFSLLLSVALFFKFSRLLSMRNWDVVTLFLLFPGLLLIQEAHTTPTAAAARSTDSLSQATETGQYTPGPTMASSSTGPAANGGEVDSPAKARLLWLGYLWLLCGALYFVVRCLLDLTLVRRPALAPNLNFGGLAWLGVALFVCLTVVAVRRPAGPQANVGKPPFTVEKGQEGAEKIVQQGAPAVNLPTSKVGFWVLCASAILCHLAIVVGLTIIGWRHFQDVHAGMAMATFYLVLPYTAYHVDQLHHVLPTALLVWTVAAYRRPALSGLFLGLAGGTGYFPVLLFPAWLSFYWRRGAARFAGSFLLALGLCLLPIVVILWMDGDLAHRIQATMAQSDWQPWKSKVVTEGFWKDVPAAAAYRLPVFIGYLALVATTLFWPSPKNLAHLLALSAAVVVGIQFWYADQGGVYVLWYLPLVLLLVFRPNLSDRCPAPVQAENDWLVRSGRAIGRAVARLLRLPEPMVRVR